MSARKSRHRTGAVAVLAASAAMVIPGQAVAAGPRAEGLIGKRLTVDVEQLLLYEEPSKSYVGSLARGASFRVRKLSRTGTYAYGLAYGGVNRRGWVRTSGLAMSPSFQVRDILTAATRLRGTVEFNLPAGWESTNRSERHSEARFDVAGPGGCVLRVSVSMRGVATRGSAREQVREAVGEAPLGRGTRRDGAWGIAGPVLPGWEGAPASGGLYGIAPIRVAPRRFGQVRVIGTLRGCAPGSPQAATFLAPGGATVRAVTRLLVEARPDVRVVRTR